MYSLYNDTKRNDKDLSSALSDFNISLLFIFISLILSSPVEDTQFLCLFFLIMSSWDMEARDLAVRELHIFLAEAVSLSKLWGEKGEQ